MDDNIANVVITRKDKKNALNQEVLELLTSTFISLKENDDVKVIVLSGEGDSAFAAGADLQEISVLADEYEKKKYYDKFNILYESIISNPKPVIAKVAGLALGGGCLLALTCDFVIATKQSKFAQPEINFGFIGGAVYLSHLIGKHRTSQITMMGSTFSSEEALALGLVNKVVEKDQLDEVVSDYCTKLKGKSEFALASIKKCIQASFETSLAEGLEMESTLATECLMTKESIQSIEGFLNKKS